MEKIRALIGNWTAEIIIAGIALLHFCFTITHIVLLLMFSYLKDLFSTNQAFAIVLVAITVTIVSWYKLFNKVLSLVHARKLFN